MTKSTTKPAKGSKTQDGGALQTVNLRYDFYRDGFRIMAAMLPVLVIALLISIGLNVFLASQKPRERFFAVDNAGRVTKIIALTAPYFSDQTVANWASDKIARAYSMDAKNFRRQIGDLEPFFTPEGYEEYKKSLEDSGTLDFMQKNLLMLNAAPTGAPVVVERGEIAGVYFWKIQIPFLVDFSSATKSVQRRRVVQLTVVRRQMFESTEGIGIQQFVARDV